MVKPELVKMAGLLSELARAIACFGFLRLELEAAHHASLLLQTDFFHVKYLIFFYCTVFICARYTCGGKRTTCET